MTGVLSHEWESAVNEEEKHAHAVEVAHSLPAGSLRSSVADTETLGSTLRSESQVVTGAECSPDASTSTCPTQKKKKKIIVKKKKKKTSEEGSPLDLNATTASIGHHIPDDDHHDTHTHSDGHNSAAASELCNTAKSMCLPQHIHAEGGELMGGPSACGGSLIGGVAHAAAAAAAGPQPEEPAPKAKRKARKSIKKSGGPGAAHAPDSAAGDQPTTTFVEIHAASEACTGSAHSVATTTDLPDTPGLPPSDGKVRARRKSRVGHGANDSIGSMGSVTRSLPLALAAMCSAEQAQQQQPQDAPPKSWRNSIAMSSDGSSCRMDLDTLPSAPASPGDVPFDGEAAKKADATAVPAVVPPAIVKKKAKRRSLRLQAMEALDMKPALPSTPDPAPQPQGELESTMPLGQLPPRAPGGVRNTGLAKLPLGQSHVDPADEVEDLFRGMSLTPRPADSDGSPAGSRATPEPHHHLRDTCGNSSAGSLRSHAAVTSPMMYTLTNSLSAFNHATGASAGSRGSSPCMKPPGEGFMASPPISPTSSVSHSPEPTRKDRFAGFGGGSFSRDPLGREGSPGTASVGSRAGSVQPDLLHPGKPRSNSASPSSPAPTTPIRATPTGTPTDARPSVSQKVMVQGIWNSCHGPRIEVHNSDVIYLQEGRFWKKQKVVEATPSGKVSVGGATLKQASKDLTKLVWSDGDMWVKEGGAKAKYRPASIEA